jgi:hypothetical protein
MNRSIGVAVVLALTACGPGNPEAGPSGSATVPAATSESDRPTASAPATGPYAPRCSQRSAPATAPRWPRSLTRQSRSISAAVPGATR